MELLSESYGSTDKFENISDVINNEISQSQDRSETETEENENENEIENNFENEFPQNIPAMPVFSGLPKMPIFMPPMPVFTIPKSTVPIMSETELIQENDNENEIEKNNTTIDVEKKIIIENEKKQKKVRFSIFSHFSSNILNFYFYLSKYILF